MVRPNMELQGFARVCLEPGETKRVTFTVSPTQMAFLDLSMKWKVEKGRIAVMIGGASDDLHLDGNFVISETRYVEGNKRKFAADVRIENQKG